MSDDTMLQDDVLKEEGVGEVVGAEEETMTGEPKEEVPAEEDEAIEE